MLKYRRKKGEITMGSRNNKEFFKKGGSNKFNADI